MEVVTICWHQWRIWDMRIAKSIVNEGDAAKWSLLPCVLVLRLTLREKEVMTCSFHNALATTTVRTALVRMLQTNKMVVYFLNAAVRNNSAWNQNI